MHAAEYIARTIAVGDIGVWGTAPIPSKAISTAEAKALAHWIGNGAKR
jgi:cytochrome c551/c552